MSNNNLSPMRQFAIDLIKKEGSTTPGRLSGAWLRENNRSDYGNSRDQFGNTSAAYQCLYWLEENRYIYRVPNESYQYRLLDVRSKGSHMVRKQRHGQIEFWIQDGDRVKQHKMPIEEVLEFHRLNDINCVVWIWVFSKSNVVIKFNAKRMTGEQSEILLENTTQESETAIVSVDVFLRYFFQDSVEGKLIDKIKKDENI